MNKIFQDFIVIFIIAAIANYSIISFWVQQHEQTHAQSCLHSGGVPQITFSNFGLSGKTSCVNGTDKFDEYSILMEQVGYQVNIGLISNLINTAFLLTTFLIFFLRLQVK